MERLLSALLTNPANPDSKKAELLTALAVKLSQDDVQATTGVVSLLNHVLTCGSLSAALATVITTVACRLLARHPACTVELWRNGIIRGICEGIAAEGPLGSPRALALATILLKVLHAPCLPVSRDAVHDSLTVLGWYMVEHFWTADIPDITAALLATLAAMCLPPNFRPFPEVVTLVVAWLSKSPPAGACPPYVMTPTQTAAVKLLHHAWSASSDRVGDEALAVANVVLALAKETVPSACIAVVLCAVSPDAVSNFGQTLAAQGFHTLDPSIFSRCVNQMLQWQCSDVLWSRVALLLKLLATGRRYSSLAAGCAGLTRGLEVCGDGLNAYGRATVAWSAATVLLIGFPILPPVSFDWKSVLPPLLDAFQSFAREPPGNVSVFSAASSVMWTLCVTDAHAAADARAHDVLSAAPPQAFSCHALSRRYRASLWCPASRMGPTGLSNLGNTCYLNSVLQCLHATSDFTSLLCRRGSSARIGPAHLCYTQFRQALASLTFSFRPVVTPSLFHRSLPAPFCGYGQQDATEILRLLLDMCSQCESDDRKKQIESVFGGIGSTTVTCGSCGTSTVTQEPFTDLSVSFDSATALERSVTDSLKAMFEVEWLSGDTAFACGTCGGFRDASRQLAVIKPPVHLIVTLNRFGFDVKTGKSHKIVTPVKVEPVLTLAVAGQASVTYDLYAVVVHIGSTLEFGHYVSYRKESSDSTLTDNSWWKCDDSVITGYVTTDRLPEDISGSGSTTPYILFYRRLDAEGGSPREPCDSLVMHSVQCDNGQYLTSLERGAEGVGAADTPVPPPKSWGDDRDDSSGGSGRGRPYRLVSRRTGHGFGGGAGMGGSYIF